MADGVTDMYKDYGPQNNDGLNSVDDEKLTIKTLITEITRLLKLFRIRPLHIRGRFICKIQVNWHSHQFFTYYC